MTIIHTIEKVGAKADSSGVTFVHPKLSDLLAQYRMIADTLAGPFRLRERGKEYLPDPYQTTSRKRCDVDEAAARYKNYLQRAVFVNFTRRTLNGMLGEVFAALPTKTLPKQLEVLDENATGEGTTLDQLAAKAVASTIAYSRCGIFVDFPDRPDGTTVEQLKTENVRPTLWVYDSWEITNWATMQIGAEDVISLIVLWEKYRFDENIFAFKEAVQYRVLRLNEQGHYTQSVYRERIPQEYKSDKKTAYSGNYMLHEEEYTPLDINGKPLTRIPFFPIGSEDNDIVPDPPSFIDLAELNIAHYRASADYEESCYMHGQSTIVVSGIDETWFDKVLGGKLRFGPHGGIPLPPGATADVLQVGENTMIKESIDSKERQIVALGAKLVEQRTVQRTAAEAKQDNASEQSILQSISTNVSSAFESALNVAQLFSGGDAEISYVLNKDFSINSISSNEIREVIESWQKDAISFKEMRDVLRKAGYATEDDDDVMQEVIDTQLKLLSNAPAVSGVKDAFE